MRHAASHNSCFRCGAASPLSQPQQQQQPRQQQQQQQQQLRPAHASGGVASTPPALPPSAKRVRIEPPAKKVLDKQLVSFQDPLENPLLEDHVLMALDDLAATRPELDWSLPVAGPCVAAVHEMLDALPATHAFNKDSSKDEAVALARKGAESALVELGTAQQDVSLAAGMSGKMQEFLAAAVTDAQSAVQSTKEALELAEKSSSSLTKLSHAALDKVRALAQEKHEHWLAMFDRKTLAVQAATEELTSDLDEAICALNMQKEELKEKSRGHELAWQAHKEDSLAAHATRVQELRQLMTEKPPSVSALDGAAVAAVCSGFASGSEMEAIRLHVTALARQLEEQAAAHKLQLTVIHREALDKVTSWQKHCDGLVAERELLKSALPPQAAPLSAEETTARASAAAAVRKDQDAVAESAGAEAMQTAEENAQQHY